MGVEFFHADIRTDMMKLTAAFRNGSTKLKVINNIYICIILQSNRNFIMRIS